MKENFHHRGSSIQKKVQHGREIVPVFLLRQVVRGTGECTNTKKRE